jgi:hypothetical protein
VDGPVHPALDDPHTAPTGSAFTVPMTVTAQPGAQVGSMRTLTVEVSYNDGATWTDATIQDGAVVAMFAEQPLSYKPTLRTATCSNRQMMAVATPARAQTRGTGPN